MRAILKELIDTLEKNLPVVTGAIIRSTGSAPRSAGARMMIDSTDRLCGTIGGGELEGKSIAAARDMLKDKILCRILDFDLSETEAAMAGMVCGGRQQVLLHKIEPSEANISLFRRAHELCSRGEHPVILTIINGSGSPQNRLYSEDLTLPQSLRPEISRKANSSSMPFTYEDENVLVFGEPLVRPKLIHFAGGGHVAQAAAQLAKIAGFQVRVMDDRPEFASRSLFPSADRVEVITDFSDCLGDLGPDDMVVIVTRGHLHDREVLKQALLSNPGYIGMIGSRKKRDATYHALRKEGFSDADFSRVHCPIGLKLGGDSPGEIGLSIVAQLQLVKSGLNT